MISGPDPRNNGNGFVDDMLHREIIEVRQNLARLDNRVSVMGADLRVVQDKLNDAKPILEGAQNAQGAIVSIQFLINLIVGSGTVISLIFGAGRIGGLW